jgi:hypothetical protein
MRNGDILNFLTSQAVGAGMSVRHRRRGDLPRICQGESRN